jgi:hypothetical protein
MILEFRATMDPHSLDVLRGGRLVAMIQWHPDRSPRFIVCHDFSTARAAEFAPSELREIADRLDQEIRRAS